MSFHLIKKCFFNEHYRQQHYLYIPRAVESACRNHRGAGYSTPPANTFYTLARIATSCIRNPIVDAPSKEWQELEKEVIAAFEIRAPLFTPTSLKDAEWCKNLLNIVVRQRPANDLSENAMKRTVTGLLMLFSYPLTPLSFGECRELHEQLVAMLKQKNCRR